MVLRLRFDAGTVPDGAHFSSTVPDTDGLCQETQFRYILTQLSTLVSASIAVVNGGNIRQSRDPLLGKV